VLKVATRATQFGGFLELRQADTTLVLDPARGGAVREFAVRGRPVLRPTLPSAGADPLELACFPMVPYCNRIAQGRFHYAGHRVRLAPNLAGESHPLHGQGWRRAWTVIDSSDASATLRFEGGGDEWPWRYRAEQRFEIDAGGLSIELSAQNLSSEAMPLMLGLHPYFNDARHARLQAQLPRVWRTDAAALPVEDAATPTAWRYDTPRAVGALPLDHCFAGWDGEAVISWPDCTVKLHAERCDHLHVYAPAGRDFFCIEPQTAAAGALVRGGDEISAVPPGERAALRLRFDVEMP
jgi:aldose 1-epimerase